MTANTTNLFNPFMEATRSVFEMMLALSDITDHPAETFACDEELDISIGVTGDLIGEVIYRFPHTTSLSIANALCGMEMKTVDEFVTSAVSEMANIISGNVVTLLEDDDLNCDILPPAVYVPDESKIYALRTARCLNSSVGDVCLDVRLNPAS